MSEGRREKSNCVRGLLVERTATCACVHARVCNVRALHTLMCAYRRVKERKMPCTREKEARISTARKPCSGLLLRKEVLSPSSQQVLISQLTMAFHRTDPL